MSWLTSWEALLGESLLGVNINYWVGMGVIALIVLLMNLYFWIVPSKFKGESQEQK